MCVRCVEGDGTYKVPKVLPSWLAKFLDIKTMSLPRSRLKSKRWKSKGFVEGSQGQFILSKYARVWHILDDDILIQKKKDVTGPPLLTAFAALTFHGMSAWVFPGYDCHSNFCL